VFRKLIGLSMAMATVVALVGCGDGGPDTGEVTGKVTYDGNPLAGAVVTFHPSTGALAAATTDTNGVYTLNAVVGDHKVSVTKSAGSDLGGDAQTSGPGEMEKMYLQAKDQMGEAKSEIPEKYADPAKSGLTTTVSSGTNTFDITLTD
jgi:hypothetical protein